MSDEIPKQDPILRDMFAADSPPEHGADFWDSLEAALPEQTTTTPPLSAPARAASPFSAEVAEPAIVPIRENNVTSINSAKSRRPAYLAAAAVAAVFAVGGAIAIGNSGDDSDLNVAETTTTVEGTPAPEGQTSTSTTVDPDAKPVAAVTGDLITATYTSESAGIDGAESFVNTGTVAFSSNGSYYLDVTNAEFRSIDAFNASTAVSYFAFTDSDSGELRYGGTANFGSLLEPEGPFKAGSYGATAAALAAAGDPSVSEITQDGRPMWRLDADLPVNQVAETATHVLAIVDQTTLIPVSIIESRNDKVTEQFTLSEIDWASQDDVSFEPPSDLDATDGTIPLVAADDVPAALPEIGEIPAGFRLASVQYAAAPAEYRTGSEASNPVGRNVVIRTYRNGFRAFRVSTLDYTSEGFGFDNPIRGEGQGFEPTQVELSGGTFEFGDSYVTVSPDTTPHIWGTIGDASADGTAYLIAGDLTAEQLASIANSFTTK